MFNQEKYYEGYKTHPQIVPLLQQLGEDLGVKPHFFRYGNKPKCKVYLSFVTEIHYNQRIQNLRQQIKDPQENSPQKVETYYLKNVGDIFPVNDNYLSESSKYKVIQFRHEYLKKLNKPLNPDAFEDQDPDNQDDVEEIVQASLYLENTYLQKFVNDLDELNYNVIDSLSLVEVMHRQGINMKYLGYIALNTTIPFIMNLSITDMVARSFKKVLNSCISDLYLQSSKWVQTDDGKKQPSNNQNQAFQKGQTFGVTKTNSQLVLNASQTMLPQQPSQTSLNNANGNQSSNSRVKEYRIRQLDELVRDAIIDVLNMLFGKDEESDKFHEILNQQVRYDFNYSQFIDIKSIQKGSLLESICYHCDLNMIYSADLFAQYDKKYNDYQKLIKNSRTPEGQDDGQKTIQLFTKDNYIDHYVSSQVFTMECLNVIQYINFHEERQENPESFEQQINSIKQHLNVLKYSNSLTFFKHVQLLSIMSKLFLQKKDYLSAAKTATDVLMLCTKKVDEELIIVPNIHLVKSMITLIQISLKKDISEEVKNMTIIATKNIMRLIKFVADENHPLFYQLTRVFINDKIKRKDISFENMKQVMESEIGGLIRALGSNHLHTADRYKDFAIYLYEYDSSSSLLYFEKAYNIYTLNQSQDESKIVSQLIGSVIASTSSSLAQKNIAESRANCAYYLCNIYYNQNKIDLCWNFLKITLSYFENKKEYLDKLCKIYLLRCNLVKRNNGVKQVVDECEQTWKFFDNYPYGKIKLLDYYKDLLKMYLETIVSTWNRNFKAQFDQITNVFKDLIDKSTKFSEKVRKQAMVQKDSAFSTQLNNVQVTESLRQSIDLSSPSNSNSYISF